MSEVSKILTQCGICSGVAEGLITFSKLMKNDIVNAKKHAIFAAALLGVGITAGIFSIVNYKTNKNPSQDVQPKSNNDTQFETLI